ncbi:hypothetical protein KDAU_57610 [Dictyobacter aurantiacus]|uniref:Uncharacterized protein n=1 Tax=Dictyobacter aurantiacus TaxID=1936993 RepID=A0A401ZNK2_9CHLR|nr:hypothetical protein KDAU_57610 [Dictyobacter aurantiacus]
MDIQTRQEGWPPSCTTPYKGMMSVGAPLAGACRKAAPYPGAHVPPT